MSEMPEPVEKRLKVHEYLAWFYSHGIRGPWDCITCKAVIRTPRYLKGVDGKKFASLTWCGQECLDKWRSQFRSSTRWEKYDKDGVLIGYILPKRGFVSLDEIQAAQMAREAGT